MNGSEQKNLASRLPKEKESGNETRSKSRYKAGMLVVPGHHQRRRTKEKENQPPSSSGVLIAR
jgi:hypothetical protein